MIFIYFRSDLTLNEDLTIKLKTLKTEDNIFVNTCKNSALKVSKWLYSLNNFNVNIIKEALYSCDHFEVIKWLYSLLLEKVPQDQIFNTVRASFKKACFSGNLELAKLLYS